MKVSGVPELLKQLAGLSRDADRQEDPQVVVGYTAGHALRVHEDTLMFHDDGQAKYLEAPARYLLPEMRRMLTDLVKKGVPLPKALLMVGRRLQAESQTLVPVQTGELKRSAFTQSEGGH